MAEEVTNDFGAKIIAVARTRIGASYVMGATGPNSYDCSSFVMTTLADVGITVPRTADAQYCYIKNGGGHLYEAADDVPIAGDLVFYMHTYEPVGGTQENCGVTHVGIMCGGGQVIECNCSTGVAEHEMVLGEYQHVFGRLKESPIKLGEKVKEVKLPPGKKGPSLAGHKGIRVTPAGTDRVKLTQLPDKKTFCEPIYPDYITVSDEVPKWIFDNVNANENAKDTAAREGRDIKNGDDPEKGPNGINYSRNDIDYLMKQNPGMTEAQAREVLSKDEKYTQPVRDNGDGTFTPTKYIDSENKE